MFLTFSSSRLFFAPTFDHKVSAPGRVICNESLLLFRGIDIEEYQEIFLLPSATIELTRKFIEWQTEAIKNIFEPLLLEAFGFNLRNVDSFSLGFPVAESVGKLPNKFC